MRISDLSIQRNSLSSMTNAKSRLSELQNLITKGVKVSKPSDSPHGAAKILYYNSQLNRNKAYSNNIDNSLSFLTESITSMESIQTETVKVLELITNSNNPANKESLKAFAESVDLALNSIIDSSNKQYDNKFVFGGTDFTKSPFGFSADETFVEIKPNDISGKHKVATSSNITQKINISGAELFGTIVKQNGNLDSGSAIGSVSTNDVQITDPKGVAYTLRMNYTKTAANTYDFTYDVLDSTNTSVLGSAPAPQSLVYNAVGNLSTVNGNKPELLNIKLPANKIEFSVNLNSLTEKGQAASLNANVNQNTNIFNTLIMIRDSLRNGVVPDEALTSEVNKFNKRILDKIAEAGDIQNQLFDTQEMLEKENSIIEGLYSKEQDIDVAKAVTDLQHQDYMLQLAYKVSSQLLPKSLLDYL